MGPPAIVIGLGSVTGLQTARLLAERGVRVIGIAGNRRHFAARTTVCEQVIQADVHGPGFLGELDRLRPQLPGGAVLYPCTDQAVLTVSGHRDRLEPHFKVMLPADDIVRTLADKASFFVHAQDHGLPVPQTVVLHRRDDAVQASRRLSYPAVLKPSIKCPTWKRHTSIKVSVVDSPAELLAAYDQLSPWTRTLIAQEYVEGSDAELFTCNVYFDELHEPLVTFVTRKRRQWPPHVGTASLGEECDNADAVAATVRLFRSAKFEGLGYLELKRDARTGRYVIMEANIGRPTGRSATAEAGGVELLYTMYCHATGQPLPSARAQRHTGAKWLDLRRDVLSAAYYYRRGELTVSDWVESLRGPKVHAVLSVRDPLPFAFELAQSARKALRRTVRRRLRPSENRVHRAHLTAGSPPAR